MGKRKHFSPPLFLSTDLFRCFVNRSVTGFSSILPVWGIVLVARKHTGCRQDTDGSSHAVVTDGAKTVPFTFRY